MCGIVGVKARPGKVLEAELIEMRDSFPYRGPDDAGHWLDQQQSIGLGHRRLSILDPSPSGHQPMHDADTGNVIAFNGEVFNYIEIRQQLQSMGYSFSTGTDTEVILKAYAAYGNDCVDHFNGMFAIAIWNPMEQELFLARDRLGIKPLYYLQSDDETLAFASEVKALRLAHRQRSQKPLALRVRLIDQYMNFGYVPGEYTLEEGINRLLPGHRAIYKDNQLTIEKYWDLEFNNEEDKGFDYYLDHSKSLLNDAIDLRLRSDVPLGIFLSGGIDSSAVVGLLAERVSEPLKTFSVAYDFGKEFNETDYARMISKKFGTEHHEHVVKPEDFKDFIPKFTDLMGEPVTESAAISLQFLSQQTKKEVTVVLSGEGSDEIFGGYDLYQYMSVIERYRSLVGSNVSQWASSGLGGLSKLILGEGNKLAKYLKLSTLSLDKRYKGISTYEDRHKPGLYRSGFKSLIETNANHSADQFLGQLFDKTKGKDALSRMLYFDTKTWLADDLLIKADRMSMGSSLELRVPFLDYRLVEFAATIPSKYKIKNGEGKYLLKKMMEDILPKEIIYRKKMGFPTPLKMMFQGELSGYARDTLLGSNTGIHDFFERSYIEKLLDEHMAEKHDHHRILWQLVVLEEWLKGRND